MLIRRLAALAAIAAIGLLALGAVSSSAATTLRTDPGGSLLAGSTTITNTSSSPVDFATNLGTLSCNVAKFDVDVSRNQSATNISGTLTDLTFTVCTDTIPLINFTSCHLHKATLPAITITGAAGGGVVTIIDPTIRCILSGSASACYYTMASASGTANNAASTLTYNPIGVVFASPTSDALGSGVCGSTMQLGVQLNHIVQGGTNRTITITTT